MTRLSRQSRVWACALLAISLLLHPVAANSGEGVADGFALRNQNPFLQIFGLPPLQSAALTRPGETDFGIAIDLANHADAGDSALETFAIDGESYFVTLSWRRRVSNWLELGIDLPFVLHDEGFLDNAIENWHDTFGMSNTKRRGPSNQLGFLYARDGTTLYELNSPSSGVGDIQLSAALSIKQASNASDATVSLRSSIKLPSGDYDDLHGSGATDFSLGVYASDTHTMFAHDLGVSGFVGGVLLGDGKVLANIQRSAVPFAGVAARWHATERLGLVAQLYAQGAYFDSDLEELGGESMQLAVGLDYRPLRRTLLLKFAIVEDVTANATTDFGLHFAIRSSGDR
jgi:hypothetical protein